MHLDPLRENSPPLILGALLAKLSTEQMALEEPNLGPTSFRSQTSNVRRVAQSATGVRPKSSTQHLDLC
jgi:hypothetical protein